MPNYVRNKVFFDGDPAEVRKMLEFIQMDGDGIGSISFNKILPMPESLNIESGSRTDEGLKMYTLYMRAKDQGQDLGKYHRYQAEHSVNWELGKQAYENIQKYGSPTWYEWCTENWGTKWPAIQPDGVPLSEEMVCFETAWAFPEGIVAKLSTLFPDITFTIKWADEDLGNNCGKAVYSNGKVIDLDIPTSQKESIEFAASVWDASPADWNLQLSKDGQRYVHIDFSPGIPDTGEAR